MTRHRSYVFTINNYTDGDLAAIEKMSNENVNYLICGQEIGKLNETPHLQGYVHFVNPRTFNSLKKKLGNGAHIEPAKGNDAQNKKYCSKEANILIEVGIPTAQGTRNDLNEIRDKIENGEMNTYQLANEHFAMWVQYRRSFAEYRRLCERTVNPDRGTKRNWETDVEIYWGPTGTGKSRRAFEENPNADVISFTGQFINGYTGASVVIIDDFDPSEVELQVMLRIMDRYPMNARVLYGYENWNPRKIIITSNYDPKDWYLGNAAFRRRVSKVLKFVIKAGVTCCLAC